MRIRGRQAGGPQLIDVVVEGENIVRVETAGNQPCDLGGPDVVVAPALLDLQVNGYGGHDFNSRVWDDQPARPETLGKVAERMAEAGVGVFCPTLVTNSPEGLSEGLKAIAQAREESPELAQVVGGVHVEGPFISPVEGPRGAHAPEHIREPDWDLFQRWQDDADGGIAILTVAPERPGAIPFIEQVVESGVVVSIGHSDAQPEDVANAVAAGATLSTHLGNGAHALIPRHPNYIWEQLACDDLTACVIGDLDHLPATVLKSFARVKGPERLCLVSDAVALGGLAPGLYTEGRHEVLPSGRVNLAKTPYLAGAGHRLDLSVANAMRCTDLGEEGALRAASLNPAKVLAWDDQLGHLRPGYRADLICFRPTVTGPLEILATVVAGRVAYRA